mgnify:CR=1 FL=1
MKQAAETTALPAFDPSQGTQVLINNNDRIEQLKSQSKGSVLLLPQKKELLLRTFNLQQEIIEKCTGPNKYHFRDVLWKMIQLGADVNYVNKQTGDTIFHYAVETDDREVIATVCQIQHVDKKKLINFVNFQADCFSWLYKSS